MINLSKPRKILTLALILSMALSIFPSVPLDAAVPEQLTVQMVSAGHDHAAAIMSDGSLWVWGSNSYGQLGDGTTIGQHKPMRLMENIAFVAAGYNFTMAIKDDGSLWAWGSNSLGRLGDGTTTHRNRPVQIMEDVVYVSAGDAHSMAIKSDGTLWGWGSNHAGRLGNGTTTHSYSPIFVMDNVTAVLAKDNTTAALRTDNSLWAWGGGRSTINIFALDVSTNRYSPEHIIDDVVYISGGRRTLFAVRKDGSIWSSGELRLGGQRPGWNDEADFSPLYYGVLTVSIRQQHALALRYDGTVWAWGSNAAGQRGDGTSGLGNWNSQPAQVLDDVVSISAGRIFSMAIRSDGSLWAWGANHHGQLGDDTTVSRTTPTMVIPLTPRVPETGVVAVSAASHHTMAIMADGTLWAWGFNNTGQFGNGTTTNRSTPVQVGQITSWESIAAGTSHSAGIRSTDSLWAWGDGTHGQLGNRANHGAAWPVAVGEQMIFGGILYTPGREIGRWSSIAVGGSHTMAIRDNGTLWAMGANSSGQLGDGTTNQRNWPTQIGEYRWLYVSANNFHTVAIREDGTLWAWGRNNYGQLGDGTTDNRHSPVQVGTANNWINVSAGANQTAAIQSDGTLWAWGRNNQGQLGDGTTDDRLLPAQVGTNSNWASVSAGAFHTVAIRTDSTLWAWGGNGAGQLGIGTSESQHTPVRVLENARTVSAGFNNTFVIKTDGSLWGFGDNGFAQLGDGTYTSRHEPVLIVSGNETSVYMNRQPVSFESALFNAMPTDENYMISPFSLRMALAMAANGASGETRTEILAALGIDDLDTFNQAAAAFIASSNENEAIEFNIANSIWLNEDLFGWEPEPIDFSENYSRIIADYFAGVAQRINAEDGPDIINAWISEQTRNAINDVIPRDAFFCEECEPFLGEDYFICEECETLAVLVNAIYFKGDWAAPFNTEHTRDGIFTDRNGAESIIPFMSQTRWFDFYESDYFQMLAKPYEDENIRMYFVLPKVDERLPFGMFKEAIGEMRPADIRLRLPRFTTEFLHENLVEILQDMGIEMAFTREYHFDFVGYTNMIYPYIVLGQSLFVWIGDVVQKSFIEVDEVGTEAAAVTVVYMYALPASYIPRTTPFYLDRPFIYLMRNDVTGDILFIGEFAFAQCAN